VASQALRELAGRIEAMAPLLASGSGGVDPRAGMPVGGSAGPAVPARLQLLLPSSPWDWPTDANGTSSAALYEFCSWMPASAGLGEPYTPSTTRFSDGYRAFLNCLQSDPWTSQALATFTNAAYYTTVLYAQAPQQPMPAWNVAEFPQAWLAGVSGGSSTAGTIRVPLPAVGEPNGSPPNATCFGVVASDGRGTPLPLGSGQGQFVDIHADAWGMITIRPAGWYDGALVTAKASGPYSTAGPSAFFGADGALRNLLTGMCVALHPTVTASVTPAFAARLQRAQSPATSVRVGGLLFESLEVSNDTAHPGGLARLTASSLATPSDAVIVGVTVAALGADSA
jgi:hypothetical protein